MLWNEFDIAEIEALWLSRIKIWGTHFTSTFSICDRILEISLNVTFYNSNIYNQAKEWELPINLKVVTMCSSHLELTENNWKYMYFEKFYN